MGPMCHLMTSCVIFGKVKVSHNTKIFDLFSLEEMEEVECLHSERIIKLRQFLAVHKSFHGKQNVNH